MLRIFTVIFTFIMTMFGVGCGGKTPETRVPVPKDDNSVVLIMRYSNYAWGRQDSGFFVTADGNVYEFDFIGDESDVIKQNEIKVPDEDHMAEYFEKYTESHDPASSISKEKIDEIQKLIPKIDENADFEEEHAACDAGQRTVYAIKDGKAVELSTQGDSVGELDDRNAKKIVRKFKSALRQESGIK